MCQEKDKIQEYINTVCKLIKNKDVHYDIDLELKDHIESLTEEYLNCGLPREVAIEKAIASMGDPLVIGRQLDKTHKAKVSWGVLIPVFLVSLFGLITMYFIQTKGAVAGADSIKMFQKNLIFYLIGIASVVGLYFFDYRKLLPYSKHLYTASIIILVLQIFIGVPVNGIYYIQFAYFAIDTTPFILMLLIISLSGMLQNWNWKIVKQFAIGIGLMVLPALLFLNATTSKAALSMYLLVCLTLMIMTKINIKQLLAFIISFILSVAFLLLKSPYYRYRLTAFLNPQKDISGNGWMTLQLEKIINSVGALGNGFTMTPKTIPELHTDFIFTYIVYTFGWITAGILIVVIAIFIIKIINVAKASKNTYGKLLVSGFVAILTTEFLINIGMNLGIAPIVGISLPFISFGGSQLITNMIIVGFILSIYRRKDISHNILSSQKL